MHAAHGTTHVDEVLTQAPDVHVHVQPFTTHPDVVVDVPVVVDSVVVLETVVVDDTVVVLLTVVVEDTVVVLVVLVVLVVVGVSVSGSSVFPHHRRPHQTEPPENGIASR